MTDVVDVVAKINSEEEELTDQVGKSPPKRPSGGSFVVPSGRRLSRMDSKNLTEQVQNSKGSFSINKDELAAVVRNIDRKESKLRHAKRMKWAMGAAIAALAVAMACTFAVTFAAVQTSKESHIDTATNTLVGLDGVPVKTEGFLSYTSLYELPAFDMSTLAQVRQLTLAMVGGMEVSFTIMDALKKRGGEAVTFTTGSGGTILIDSRAKIARATVNGKTYVVDTAAKVKGASGPARRLAAEAAALPPKLYTKEDFFTEARGFVVAEGGGGRKLADDSTLGGWASIALAVAEAVLDTANNEEHQGEFSRVYLKMNGAFPGGPTMHMDVLYGTGAGQIISKVVDDSGSGHAEVNNPANKALYQYEYDKGAVTTCDVSTIADGSAQLSGVALSAFLDQVVVDKRSERHAVMVTLPSGGSEAVTVYLEVEETVFDPDEIPFDLPSHEDCNPVPASASAPTVEGSSTAEELEADLADRGLLDTEDSDESDAERRRRLTSYTPITLDVAQAMADASYQGEPNQAKDWNRFCSSWENSYSCLFYRFDTKRMVLGISGTDITSFQDIRDDLDTEKTPNGDHRGFYRHAELVRDRWGAVMGKLSASLGWHLEAVVGHSLGGAAATVAVKRDFFHPDRGVITFGAPVTIADSVTADETCDTAVEGQRIYHELDSIPSDGPSIWPFGGKIFGAFDHDVEKSYEYRTQTSSYNCGWRWKRTGWAWTYWHHCDHRQSNTCHQRGCYRKSDNDGCQGWWSCATNFAGTHTNYASWARVKCR